MLEDVKALHAHELDSISYFSNLAKEQGFGELHFKLDIQSGLFAVIAIHSTKLGPALGGCRCIEYDSPGAAILDAMRLSRAMSFKSALAGLPHGGGKAVLMRPAQIQDKNAYFKVYGQFLNDLGGRYITAKDSGISMSDLDIIVSHSPFVAGYDRHDGTEADPSVYTAHGILRGIEAAVHYKLKRNTLKDLHVAIQGVGAVGYNLAKLLHEQGVKLTVCDVDSQNVARCVKEFDAAIVASDKIFDVACDVLAPCALGAVLNDETIPLLKCPIVAGAANNQLQELRHADILMQRGILYAPDYVINAGGVIYAATVYDKQPEDKIYKKIDDLYDKLLEIYKRADQEKISTNAVAIKMVQEILG